MGLCQKVVRLCVHCAGVPGTQLFVHIRYTYMNLLLQMVCALPGCTGSMCLVCATTRHEYYVSPCQPAVSNVNILDGRNACGDDHCRCRAMQPSLDLLICERRRQHVGGLSLSSGQARSGFGVVADF